MAKLNFCLCQRNSRTNYITGTVDDRPALSEIRHQQPALGVKFGTEVRRLLGVRCICRFRPLILLDLDSRPPSFGEDGGPNNRSDGAKPSFGSLRPPVDLVDSPGGETGVRVPVARPLRPDAGVRHALRAAAARFNVQVCRPRYALLKSPPGRVR